MRRSVSITGHLDNKGTSSEIAHSLTPSSQARNTQVEGYQSGFIRRWQNYQLAIDQSHHLQTSDKASFVEIYEGPLDQSSGKPVIHMSCAYYLGKQLQTARYTN